MKKFLKRMWWTDKSFFTQPIVVIYTATFITTHFLLEKNIYRSDSSGLLFIGGGLLGIFVLLVL